MLSVFIRSPAPLPLQGSRMAGERILFVCFDFASLIPRERLLLARGYQVSTVLGLDGVMGAKDIQDFDFILIGDEGTQLERQRSVFQLKEECPRVPIIVLCSGLEPLAGADYRVSTADPNNWFEAVVDRIRHWRKLA
jgi:hypothetical protein